MKLGNRLAEERAREAYRALARLLHRYGAVSKGRAMKQGLRRKLARDLKLIGSMSDDYEIGEAITDERDRIQYYAAMELINLGCQKLSWLSKKYSPAPDADVIGPKAAREKKAKAKAEREAAYAADFYGESDAT